MAGRSVVDDEIRRKRLVAVFPRVYARPWTVADTYIRRRAALVSVGGDVALSHVTALEIRELPVGPPGPIHVTAFNPRHPRGVAGELVAHRTKLRMAARAINRLPVVGTEVALVDSWPILPAERRRAPVIEAARRGLVRPTDLAAVAESRLWIPGIAELRRLVGHLLVGCESELELWGYLSVFDVPGLRHAGRQRKVIVDGVTFRLDMAYDQERVAVELDGSAYHWTKDRWERDLARDAALATAGWLTIRLSHGRLTRDIDGCRRDVLRVLATRRGRTT